MMTFKIGIVGSSNADISVMPQIKQFINDQKQKHKNLEIVSGGAKGIDNYAEQIAKELEIPVKTFNPETKDWVGFKARNMEIANYSDKVVSFARPWKNNRLKCYHCNANHEKTAGCWTAKYAKKLGKETEIIILNE